MREASRTEVGPGPWLSGLRWAFGLALALVAAPAGAEVGIVTFTVDNSSAKFFNVRMPEFFDRGIPGTLFGHIKGVGTRSWDMSWDDVRSLAGHGWEFGAHGYGHAHKLKDADDDVLEMELGVPAARIYLETGSYPVTFASPYGSWDDRVLERVRVYYKAHFAAWGNEGINPFDRTDHYRINRKQVSNQKSVEQICAEIERAGREGDWLVYMWHEVKDVPTERIENSVEQFEGVLDCAARLRDEGVVRLMTGRDALEVVPHRPR